MPRTLLKSLPLCALILAAACASVSVGADFAPGFALLPYRTFDWGAGDTLPAGDPRLDHNPFFDARVRAAVERELAAKGLTRNASAPDLLIHYHASVRQRVDVIHTDEARGYTGGEMSMSEKVLEYDEGTLLLDMADARTRRIVWRGWAQTDVDQLLDNQREMEKRINASVQKMIAQLPHTP